MSEFAISHELSETAPDGESNKRRLLASQRAARMAVSLELNSSRLGFSVMPSGINEKFIKPVKEASKAYDEAKANDVLNMSSVDKAAIDALRPANANSVAVTPPTPAPFRAPNQAK